MSRWRSGQAYLLDENATAVTPVGDERRGVAVSVRPGAEPYAHDGDDVGALLCRDLTGNPSVPSSASGPSSRPSSWRYRSVSAELSAVNQPLALIRSRADHVVPEASSTLILDRVTSRQKEQVIVEKSFPVAILDNDAAMIMSSISPNSSSSDRQVSLPPTDQIASFASGRSR
jgi:fermentation-respiration switch protein FrsA (DUF1100 family)